MIVFTYRGCVVSKRSVMYISGNQYYNPNFQAMKKSQFKGIDYAVVEKFKAPIEKFDVIADFQNWAKTQVQVITERKFPARSNEAVTQRKWILKDWFDYVTKGNDAYSWAMRLLILAGVTSELSEKNDTLPPMLSKGVLADTVFRLNSELQAEPKKDFSFNKLYKNNLRSHLLNDTNTGTNKTGWVVIPSKKNNPDNFEANVDKLKTLSYKTWCTKSFNAEPYLSEGDFHVYLENGQPKLGVRFVDGAVKEIQGVLNNGKIPLNYFEIFEKYRKENNLQLNQYAEKEVDYAIQSQKGAEGIKKELAEAIEKHDMKRIFEYFGMKPEEGPDGKFIISRYKVPACCSYADLGINDAELFKSIYSIRTKSVDCKDMSDEAWNIMMELTMSGRG